MGDTNVESIIEALRKEIDRIGDLDDASRERLENLIAGMERKLEHPEDSDEHRELVGRVRAAIEHFEVSHPDLTGTLNRIMATLGNMGV